MEDNRNEIKDQSEEIGQITLTGISKVQLEKEYESSISEIKQEAVIEEFTECTFSSVQELMKIESEHVKLVVHKTKSEELETNQTHYLEVLHF